MTFLHFLFNKNFKLTYCQSLSGVATSKIILKMDEDKNIQFLPSERPKVKRSKIRKNLIIVVIVVLIVLSLFVAIGVCLFTNTFHKIKTIYVGTGENHNQFIYVDLTSNIIEYNVQDNGINAIYVDDYNMFLSLVKLTTDDGVVCFATPLNVTQKPELTKVIKNMTALTIDGFGERTFVRSKIPIPDISFMNRKSRNMCKGISTYWAYPVCMPSNKPRERKRGLCESICTRVCKKWKSPSQCDNYCGYADNGCTVAAVAVEVLHFLV